MTFMVTLDLYSVLLVCLIPPVIVFLCSVGYYGGIAVKHVIENKYVSKLIEENNKVWCDYLRLQAKVRNELED